MSRGDFIITASGTHFYPFDPRPEEIHIEDIAHALAQVTRWTGHAPVRYSVAQHSLFVSYRTEELSDATPIGPDTAKLSRIRALEGLLHDGTEAYLSDVAKPIKPRLANYREIEDGLARAIGKRFGVALEELSPIVVQADLDLLVTEASVFFPRETWWRPGDTAQNVHHKGGEVLTSPGLLAHLTRGVPPSHVPEVSWQSARDAFLRRFHELTASAS